MVAADGRFFASRGPRARVNVVPNRLVSVLAKGVVVVPNTAGWTGPWLGATRATSLQRIANRPIICHVLDALADVGVHDVAVVSPPDVAEEIVACMATEGPSGLALR